MLKNDLEEIIWEEVRMAFSSFMPTKVAEELRLGAERSATRISKRLEAERLRLERVTPSYKPAPGCNCGAERIHSNKHANWCMLTTGR